MPQDLPIIFLDIDGVLQPLSSQKRFEHDLTALRAQLAAEVDPGYRELNQYDIGAVKYDWHQQAMDNLRELCRRTGAFIVVSSAWREGKSMAQLKLLFRIHDLDLLIIDKTAELHSSRDLQIHAYLQEHPEIRRFVILDDGHVDCLRRRFPREFVFTERDNLDRAALAAALSVLRSRGLNQEQRARQSALEALLNRDPRLIQVKLDLADIDLYRRSHKLGALVFLGLLCEAVADCPNLQRLVLRDLKHDFMYDESRDLDPEALVEEAARQNPALRHVDLKARDGGPWARSR